MQAYSDMPGVMHQRTKCEVIFCGSPKLRDRQSGYARARLTPGELVD